MISNLWIIVPVYNEELCIETVTDFVLAVKSLFTKENSKENLLFKNIMKCVRLY